MKRSYIKYILALLMFGSNGIVASHISLSSYEIVFLRTMLGSLLLFGLFFLSGGRFSFFRQKRQAVFLALSGMAMGGSWLFLYEAYASIGVSLASLAYYCGPVIVMALSPLVFKERLTWPKILGFLTVLAGIVLVNGSAVRSGMSAWGIFCGVMSALMYAGMVVLNKKAGRIQGLENAALQLFFGFLTVAAFTGIKGGFAINPAAGEWPWILALGLINTGLGCYLYFSSIGWLRVQTVAVCGYLEPLSAVLLSAAFLGERLLWPQVLGAACIIGGALFGEVWNTRRREQRHSL